MQFFSRVKEFFTSTTTIIIILAVVGVGILASAAILIVISDFAPPAEVDIYEEYPDDTDPGIMRPPMRWDDVFLEENRFEWPASRLTGLDIYEDAYFRRPLAVVINNIHMALPQSGITSADIIYEVLSEGDVTRLVGIFQSDIPDKIGPVRSARDYFVDFAFNHDAIFIHHGASPGGYTRIRGSRINSFDGMAWEGILFWRDRTFPYWARNTGTRALEHSSYTGWHRIEPQLYERGTRAIIDENPAYGFAFGEITAPPAGEASRVVVPFSPAYIRTFIFDADTGLYLAENRDGPHLDALNQQQLAAANILVQFTTQRVVDGEGRRTVQTIGSGSGYLVTRGNYYPLTWEKDDLTTPTRWYFEDGEPLVLSPGVTWICVFPANGVVEFE